MSEEYTGDDCCEYDGCLRSFMGNQLDGCDCLCHDWAVPKGAEDDDWF